MKIFLNLLVLTAHLFIASWCLANQALESVNVPSDLIDGAEPAQQRADASGVDGPADAGDGEGDEQILLIDESTTASSTSRPEINRNVPRSDIPSIGYVPESHVEDGGFDLVAASASRWDNVYLSAIEHEREKKNGLALIEIEELLAQRPQHEHALLARGRLLVKTQQYPQARTNLLAMTKSRPDDWRPWFWLGTAHLMLDELTLAEAAFDEALSRNGEVVETWLHRALVEQQRGNWRVALQLLSIADEVSPNHPLVMLNVAMCREALGYIDEAAAGYRKFLAQSHHANGSKLLRFEVINHLSRASLAEQSPAVEMRTEPALTERYTEDIDRNDFTVREYPPSNMP